MPIKLRQRTRAQTSRAAIQRLYVAMRHLIIRGSYKPLGVSGEAMIESLKLLSPEIYGSLNDPEKVELDGLLYIFQRLPMGIEGCRFIKLISREGFENSDFDPIIPPKRRRNSYRIDPEQMFIEMSRGKSDIYDILTHLTFMYIEAEKIRNNSLDNKGNFRREWEQLKAIVEKEEKGEEFNVEVAYTYLSTLLGRTYSETVDACQKFSNTSSVNSIFKITYFLGKISHDEQLYEKDREISFSSALREKIGQHAHGELWAQEIKSFIVQHKLLHRPIKIISANLHSIMTSIYAPIALKKEFPGTNIETIAKELSKSESAPLRDKVRKFALANGMKEIIDLNGMNIDAQIFDLANFGLENLPEELNISTNIEQDQIPVFIVIDYAFGEQAYEVMDELLKPYEIEDKKVPINVTGIAIMGKAGTLKGQKGDIMIPNAHVFEGSADNYPVYNLFSKEDFQGNGLAVFDDGPMVTVLGTSLQNKDILRYFAKSSWGAIGLEMEGAHYQKAIQGASFIRKSVKKDIQLYYAYYASDNPLISGQTLASGGLGIGGVKPTYLISKRIIQKFLS